MEKLLQLQIEKLPEGVYLATSDALPGLVAQGETLTETLEIARDVASKLIEARRERQPLNLESLQTLAEKFDYPLVISE
ncbi:MAG: type II toxin-antitoxin system HicB family antitoxin [Okeania sp. SIO3B5]|uniref:type II toxin-antitoxin system HicB family antitoxin n=1 Tax=Okeania sp. SIO3B5 TaxID=2607811 RepID=UPI0014002CC7|nr:type II toxin-antitoxin system HicB family antitoxin [Okeania sp. SIO3B5]NEO53386.1 type II toxin-antitoxin system HicB family antitoxin [Okeania sp. SIO3B5]